MPTLTIPAGVAAVTPEWLTLALGDALAPGSRVASMDLQRIGEGVGFLGELARVRLSYAGDPGPHAPASVIVKLPTQDPAPRGLAGAFGFYHREVGFYRDLAAEVGVRVPRSYHAISAPAEADFALVMEDIEATPGDQLASCTEDQAKLAMTTLARIHAKWWESPRLATFDWLPTKGDPYFQVMNGAYQQVLPIFLEHWADQFDPAVVRVCEKVAGCFDALIDGWYEHPLTLAHQDYRLDNMLFGTPGTPDELVVIDWQLCQHSMGALDLQYFIAGNLRTEVAATQTDDLLRLYHAELQAGGVRGYPFAQLRDDYASASAILALYLVLGITAIDPNNQDERGRQLIELLFHSHADAILRYEAERFLPV